MTEREIAEKALAAYDRLIECFARTLDATAVYERVLVASGHSDESDGDDLLINGQAVLHTSRELSRLLADELETA